MDKLDRTLSPAPECLTKTIKGIYNYRKKGLAWKAKYLRTHNSKDFSWGQYNKKSNSEHIVEALQPISHKHCFYCDAKNIDYGLMQPIIDHFCPKTISPLIAYFYPNLMLSCSSCNSYKGDKYNKRALLKFDRDTYTFDEHYYIDFESGQIIVRPDIDFSKQVRARYTLFVLGINKAARPSARKAELEQYEDGNNPNIDNFSYRFYIIRS